MRNIKAKSFSIFIFALFAICFVSMSLVTGTAIRDIWSALKIAYKTIPPTLFLWMMFVIHAWKWKVFQGWLVPFPCIDGTWQGRIQTTWINPETGERPGPIPVILTIRQSFVRISCVMRTAEMTSRSYLAGFWLDSDEQIRKLGYSYTSTPSIIVRERSQPHDGTAVLELIGDPVNKLRGAYWTQRKTTGEIVLTFRCKKRLEEYPADLGGHPMQNKSNDR